MIKDKVYQTDGEEELDPDYDVTNFIDKRAVSLKNSASKKLNNHIDDSAFKQKKKSLLAGQPLI